MPGPARWRAERAVSRFATDTLYHVSDAHGQHGALPNWAEGQTWDTLHDALHEADEYGGREPHDHDNDEGDHRP